MTDLIDYMMQRIRHIEPHITDEKALQLERALRLEFGGVVTRTRKRMNWDGLWCAVMSGHNPPTERLRNPFTPPVHLAHSHLP